MNKIFQKALSLILCICMLLNMPYVTYAMEEINVQGIVGFNEKATVIDSGFPKTPESHKDGNIEEQKQGQESEINSKEKPTVQDEPSQTGFKYSDEEVAHIMEQHSLTKNEVMSYEAMCIWPEQIEMMLKLKSKYQFTQEQAYTLIHYYPGDFFTEKAVEKLNQLVKVNYKNITSREIQDYFWAGYDVDHIREAIIISEVMDQPFASVIVKNPVYSLSNRQAIDYIKKQSKQTEEKADKQEDNNSITAPDLKAENPPKDTLNNSEITNENTQGVQKGVETPKQDEKESPINPDLNVGNSNKETLNSTESENRVSGTQKDEKLQDQGEKGSVIKSNLDSENANEEILKSTETESNNKQIQSENVKFNNGADEKLFKLANKNSPNLQEKLNKQQNDLPVIPSKINTVSVNADSLIDFLKSSTEETFEAKKDDTLESTTEEEDTTDIEQPKRMPFAEQLILGQKRLSNRIQAREIQGYEATVLTITPENFGDYYLVNFDFIFDKLNCTEDLMDTNCQWNELLNKAITWEVATYGEFENQTVEQSKSEEVEGKTEEPQYKPSRSKRSASRLPTPSNTGEDNVQYPEVSAPYSVSGGKNETISMATGAFQFDYPIAKLQSSNSNNSFNLNLIYDLDEAGESKRYIRPRDREVYPLILQDEVYEGNRLVKKKPKHYVYFLTEKAREKAAETVDAWYKKDWGSGNVTTKNLNDSGSETIKVYVNLKNEGQNPIEEATHLGDGWMWNIPIFDIGVGNSSVTIFTLHLPGKGKFIYNPEKSKTKFVGYPRSDISIRQSGNEYIVETKDGMHYYFSTTSGLISQQIDRYGNQITYTYNSQNQLTAIRDLYNRTIRFDYSSGQVKVTSPDGNATILHLTNGMLSEIIDGEGRESKFTYEKSAVSYSFLKEVKAISATNINPKYGEAVVVPDVGSDSITKLKSVEHPTGVTTNYIYTIIKEDLGQGFVDHYKLSERSDSINGQVFNQKKYTHVKYTSSDKTYTYTSSYSDKLDNNEIRKYSYKFNEKHLPIEEEFNAPAAAGSKALNKKITRVFDSYELPEKETEVISNGSATKTLIRLFDYDSKGNLLSETNEKAEGNANGEYTTTYTYDSNYSLPLTKTYKQDAGTAIKIENILAPGGKDIGWTNIYENGALKNKVQYLYDGFGNVTEKQEFPDVNGTPISTYYSYSGGYNGANRTKEWVTDVKDADGQSLGTVEKSYTYDAMGRLLTEKDGNGNTSSTAYDKVGRPIKITDAKGAVQSYSYNDSANTTTFTDKNHTSYLYSYDPLGRLVSTKNMTANGLLIAAKTYDAIGRLLSESKNQDAQGIRNIRYQYDNLDRKTGMSYYEGSSSGTPVYNETYLYEDVLGNGGSKLTKTAGDRTTTQYWNKYGELIQEGGVLGGSDQMTSTYHDYNYVGQKTADKQYINGQLTVVSAYDLDHQGQVIKTTDALGGAVTARFNGMGRVVEQTDKAGKATISIYDKLGRLIKQELPFTGGKKSLKVHYYDKNGNVVKTKQTNQADNSDVVTFAQTEYIYDATNKLTDTILTTDASSKMYTHYTFDAAGNTTAMYTGLTQPYSASLPASAYTVTKYEYDSENRLVKTIYADGTFETIEYDKNGNKKATTDCNGNRTVFTYNTIGKLANENAGAKQKNYTYTNSGELLSEEESGIRIQYSYDDLGRQIQITEPNGVVKNYTYDNFGNRLTFTLSVDGKQKTNTSYGYDKLNRLTTVKENGAAAASYTYDANGNRKTLTNANGTAVDYTYNDANLITGLTNKKGAAILSSYSYTYNLDGNQRTKTDHTGKTTVYTYDLAGRLTKEAESGGNTMAYTFDSRNNRSTLTVTGKENYSVVYTYNPANNRLLQETKTVGDKQEISTYSYDKNGNQLLKTQSVLTEATGAQPEVSLHISAPVPSDLGATISTYDVWNRLTQVENKSGISSYAYYPNNLRYTKDVNGTALCQVWDGSNLALEYTPQTKVDVRKYVRGINLISMDAGANKSYYLFNAHGDVVQLSDAAGGVTQTYDYDAFGNQKTETPIDTNPFRYCGEYFDAETDTIYLRARYYDPSVGRFTRQDPAKDGLNWYIYTANNPIRFIDPSGLIPTALEAAYMSQHIYNATNIDKNKDLGNDFGRWMLADIMTNSEGLKIGVYSRTVDGVTEYSLVNKGTNTMGDWIDNIQQPFGVSNDMKDSILKAKEFVKKYKNNEITFVGHSKGGAEAAANAVATNKNSILFNPATVNLSAYNLNFGEYSAEMNAYIVNGEILNNIFGLISSPINNAVYLPNQNNTPWWVQGRARKALNLYNSIENHLMPSVINALKEVGYN